MEVFLVLGVINTEESSMKICLLFITVIYTVIGQQLKFDTTLLPSDATTDSIKHVVNELLDAISTSDSSKAAKLVLKEGHVMRVSQRSGDKKISFRSNRTFIEETGSRTAEILERMWNPVIIYRGDIAVAWTTYDLHINGKFSHCGAETFNLVRKDNTWLIFDWAYTVEPNNCDESPLGPYPNKK